MRTLANPAMAEQTRQRLHSVCEDDERLWGVMTPGQMVCHLRGAFLMATGAEPVEPVHTGWRARAMKALALRAPLRWPRGVETVRELEVGAPRMQPTGDFEGEKQSLLRAYDDFLRCTQNWSSHPLLGAMEPRDWMRWGYLHADHHLRQFGR